MSSPAPICTHIKTDGIRCGSPAVSGTDLCHHHSAIKTATSQAASTGRPGSGEFAPIPFVFPEDRASMQINFFLLLQAFNQHQIDLRTFKAMMSMLKAMKANLGKTGSLVEEARDQESGTRDQKSRDEGSGRKAQKSSKQRDDFDDEEDDPFADLRHLPEREFNAAIQARVNEMFAEERAEEERQKAAAASAH